MTVVGQCLGAGRKDEQFYYIKKLSVLAEIIVVASVFWCCLNHSGHKLGGMEHGKCKNVFHMISWITGVKPIVWTLAFIPASGLRAAGDVKFSCLTSASPCGHSFLSLCISDPFQRLRPNGCMDWNVLLTGQCGESYVLFASTVGNG